MIDIDERLKELSKFSVGQIMKRDITEEYIVNESTDIEEILTMFKKVNYLWVVKDKGKGIRRVIGIITSDDIMYFLTPKRHAIFFGHPNPRMTSYSSEKASHLMSKTLFEVSSGTSLKKAVNIMVTHDVDHLPVVLEGRLVGEITLNAIINKLV